MTDQDYTQEEVALKRAIEQTANQIEPDSMFVDNLEAYLMKHSALASTNDPTIQRQDSKPVRSFWPRWIETSVFSMFFGGHQTQYQSEPTHPQSTSAVRGAMTTIVFMIIGLIGLTGVIYRILPTIASDNDVPILAAISAMTNTPTTASTSTATVAFTDTPMPNSTLDATDLILPTLKFTKTPTVTPTPADTVTPTKTPMATSTTTPIPTLQLAQLDGQPTTSIYVPSSSDVLPPTGGGHGGYDPNEHFMTPVATPIPPPDMFFNDYGVNPLLSTTDEHVSTFAIDIDTASYTLARNYLTDVGQLPPPGAIRAEEFINYFNANYPSPRDDDPAFTVHLDAAPSPFGENEFQLLRVGIQGREIKPADRDPALLIFVVDVSGSMADGNRLELVKQTLALLVDELDEQDRIGIVAYSDSSRTVLKPTRASDKSTILSAVNTLFPENSTNVDAGLQLGYQMAQQAMQPDQITRVILLSDGVANVDSTSPTAILDHVQNGVAQGITLSTIGVGMGNYNDVLMEQLANDGNGNYFYVDDLSQARRIFVHNLVNVLQVIGYDAKIQVEFNPAVVSNYRLIGYENRAMANEDFRRDMVDDQPVDAGEVGAGHSVTALYEVALTDGERSQSELLATARIRWRDAEIDAVIETSQVIKVSDLKTSIDDVPFSFRLHATAAEFAELLRQSYWSRSNSFSDLANFATKLERDQPDSLQVAELVELIRQAEQHAPNELADQRRPLGKFILLAPTNTLSPIYGPIEFQWQWTGELAPNQGFEVRVWLPGETELGAHDAILDSQLGKIEKNGDYYRLQANIKDAAGVGNRTGLYLWRVALIEITPSYRPLGIESSTAPLRFEQRTTNQPAAFD